MEKEKLTPLDSGIVWSVMLVHIIPEKRLDVFWLEFGFVVFSHQHPGKVSLPGRGW